MINYFGKSLLNMYSNRLFRVFKLLLILLLVASIQRRYMCRAQAMKGHALPANSN